MPCDTTGAQPGQAGSPCPHCVVCCAVPWCPTHFDSYMQQVLCIGTPVTMLPAQFRQNSTTENFQMTTPPKHM